MSENREDWLEQRKTGIGGSDAAAIIGQNPYMSNVDLWEIKTYRKEQPDISNKPCVIYGTKAEDHIRELFKLDYPQYEVTHEDFVTHSNPEYPFIRGSFDGEIYDKNLNRNGVLEIKTSTLRRKTDLEKWDNQIPQNYYCQVLHYFLVREDFEFAILKAKLLLPYQNFYQKKENPNQLFYEVPAILKHYYIDRYDDQVQSDLNYLFEAEKEFWQYVEDDIMPPLVLPNI